MTRGNIPEEFWWRMVMDTLYLRRRLFQRFPVATAYDLAEMPAAQVETGLKSVARWCNEKRIFSVRDGDREYFPHFQFDQEGAPLPSIAELLAILGQHKARSDWDNALWFAGANGWLNGPCPIEILLADPELVRDAAEQEVLPHIE
jgi:hypothetical protein